MTKRTDPPDTHEAMTYAARRFGVIQSLIQSANTMAQHVGISPVAVASCYLVAAVNVLSNRRLITRDEAEVIMDETRALFDQPDGSNTPRMN